ncbi:hypothetical protein [Crenobacter cavernae]|uniref:Cation transporter n=1 Tax=Crenobacter cavernae TaxID=2290923 RepID=A0ABY0FC59_9NEIS|nr:hypothetical protein [Crenobacter cavernae]RXZ42196.1 hypothetical protein EBB06_14215 [Crenobacter cavernae]
MSTPHDHSTHDPSTHAHAHVELLPAQGWPSLMAMAAWQRLVLAAGLLALLWGVVAWALGGEA